MWHWSMQLAGAEVQTAPCVVLLLMTAALLSCLRNRIGSAQVQLHAMQAVDRFKKMFGEAA